MNVNIPVKMFPLTPGASSSGGLVVAVLIGLAIFMSQKNKVKA